MVDGRSPAPSCRLDDQRARQGPARRSRSQVTDRYASDYDITYESAWELADFVWSLSGIPGVTIDDVTMSSDVTEDSSRWRLSGPGAVADGCPGSRSCSGSPVLARAGKKLTLRIKLTGVNDSRYVPVELHGPREGRGEPRGPP